MTIYQIDVHAKTQRFMESPLMFTERMCVIADSCGQAVLYARDRYEKANDEVRICVVGAQEVTALFDIRGGKENVIV